MKNLFITTALLGAVFVNTNALCGTERGNGGSGSEVKLSSKKAEIEMLAGKIRNFFSSYQSELSKEYPEFKIQNLINKLDSVSFSVTNSQLTDKYGKVRTCLNFPISNKIQCQLSKWNEIKDEPEAQFALIFHEALGLLGVEETAPTDAKEISGYLISSRLVEHVSKIRSYGLVLNRSEASTQSNGETRIWIEESTKSKIQEGAIDLYKKIAEKNLKNGPCKERRI